MQLASVQSLFTWVPDWVVGILVMVVPGLSALVLYRWFTGRLTRLAARFSPFLHQLLRRAEGPVGVLIVLVVLGIALPAAPFTHAVKLTIGHLLLIGLILVIGWAAGIALNLGAERYVRRFRTDTADNLLARKHMTQVHILRRAAQTLLAMVTVSAALMTIEAVRQYGVSLLASAGAAGLVLGLAARPVFSNLLAGIQIAITQPIRVEDAVVVEGEYGWIETITSTYVVVRIWDLRRMVLPLTYFIEKPFQNWTYQSANLLGSVMLNVDYSVSVDRMRQKLEEIARGSDLWDGKVAALQVTDTPGSMVQLRALVSAQDSGRMWDLRCLVRERLIAFLRAEYPQALPRSETIVIPEASDRPRGDGRSPVQRAKRSRRQPASKQAQPDATARSRA